MFYTCGPNEAMVVSGKISACVGLTDYFSGLHRILGNQNDLVTILQFLKHKMCHNNPVRKNEVLLRTVDQ